MVIELPYLVAQLQIRLLLIIYSQRPANFLLCRICKYQYEYTFCFAFILRSWLILFLLPQYNRANGILCFGPATFVSVAFILSQFAQQGCSFIGLPESEGQNTGIFDKSTAAYAGIYCWQGVTGQKWLYSVDWEGLGFAKDMALATTVMGAVVWCFYLFSSCMRYHPAIWFLLSLTLLATTITQSLQFQLFSNDLCSDGGCTLGTSSRVGISACVFWFISAIMTCGEFLLRLARTHSIPTMQCTLMSHIHSTFQQVLSRKQKTSEAQRIAEIVNKMHSTLSCDSVMKYSYLLLNKDTIVCNIFLSQICNKVYLSD